MELSVTDDLFLIGPTQALFSFNLSLFTIQSAIHHFQTKPIKQKNQTTGGRWAHSGFEPSAVGW